MKEGTSRFEKNQLLVEDIYLQPPLDKIICSGIVDVKVSQYYFDEPIFDEYEATTVRATWDFDAARSIVCDGDEVLDLACGDGRLLLHLAENYKLGKSIGVDIAEIAINRFAKNIENLCLSNIQACLGDIFALPQDIQSARYDVITFGDAAVNFILEDNKLCSLLSIACNLLRDKTSKVLISIFADGTPEKLAFMDKRCTVVPFRLSDGKSILLWWAYKYDPEHLIIYRSVFAQSGWNENGDISGVVCDLRDRMWTPSTIAPIAQRAGLRVERIMESSVQDGAAVGMATAVMILSKL